MLRSEAIAVTSAAEGLQDVEGFKGVSEQAAIYGCMTPAKASQAKTDLAMRLSIIYPLSPYR